MTPRRAWIDSTISRNVAGGALDSVFIVSCPFRFDVIVIGRFAWAAKQKMQRITYFRVNSIVGVDLDVVLLIAQSDSVWGSPNPL